GWWRSTLSRIRRTPACCHPGRAHRRRRTCPECAAPVRHRRWRPVQWPCGKTYPRLLWSPPEWPPCCRYRDGWVHHRSEEHTSELQSRENLVCRLLLEKKKHRSKKMVLGASGGE